MLRPRLQKLEIGMETIGYWDGEDVHSQAVEADVVALPRELRNLVSAVLFLLLCRGVVRWLTNNDSLRVRLQ
jgi:hypothetical protein